MNFFFHFIYFYLSIQYISNTHVNFELTKNRQKAFTVLPKIQRFVAQLYTAIKNVYCLQIDGTYLVIYMYQQIRNTH